MPDGHGIPAETLDLGGHHSRHAQVMPMNVAIAKALIETFPKWVAPAASCACRTAVGNAILTDRAALRAEDRERLRLLLDG